MIALLLAGFFGVAVIALLVGQFALERIARLWKGSPAENLRALIVVGGMPLCALLALTASFGVAYQDHWGLSDHALGIVGLMLTYSLAVGLFALFFMPTRTQSARP